VALSQQAWARPLAGDIVIERENGTVYVPLATCLFLSLLLSLVFWVANR
jgi:hypothetical protein